MMAGSELTDFIMSTVMKQKDGCSGSLSFPASFCLSFNPDPQPMGSGNLRSAHILIDTPRSKFLR